MMELKPIEAFFYYQDKNYATVLIVDYQRKIVRKIYNYPPQICMQDDSMQFISVETANKLFLGLNSAFFHVQAEGYDNSPPTEQQKRLMMFMNKINEKVNEPSYFAIIQEEYRLHNIFGEKRLKFSDVVDKHNESILKIDKNLIHEALKDFTVDEDLPEAQRIDMIIDRLKNAKENGYDKVKEKLMQNKEYRESDELAKNIQPAFMEFFKALINTEVHASKELELYSDKYKQMLDFYANKGYFIYCA